MKLVITTLLILTLATGAITWEYPVELAHELRYKTEAFLQLYEMASIGTFMFNGIEYDLPTEALNQVRADCIAAYNEMVAAQIAIKDWATQ